jgi:hypothetical protein
MPNAADFGRIGTAIMAAAPSVLPKPAAAALRAISATAIDGVGKVPGARASAGAALAKRGDAESAIDAIVRSHIAFAGAQGFATNVGGTIALLVGLPANLAGLTLLQTRMTAAIAHLRGYDTDDSRVRAAIMMTLLGRDVVRDLVEQGKLPSTPLGLATAPAFDRSLEQSIAEQVLQTLLARSGGKQTVALVGKRIPVIGGGVGLVTDGWATLEVAHYAREQFPSRRQLVDDAG